MECNDVFLSEIDFSKLFEIGEQATISGMALELAGYNNEIKVVKDLKN